MTPQDVSHILKRKLKGSNLHILLNLYML